MEYNQEKLNQVKGAIIEYMTNRFPIKTLVDVLPTYDRIKESQAVKKVLSEIWDDASFYLRKSIQDLLEENFLVLKQRGPIHLFHGNQKESFDQLFLSLELGSESDYDKKTKYDYISPKIGFGTCADNHLIWPDYDPDDI